MTSLRLITLAAALALLPHAPDAASRARKSAAKPPPHMSHRNPAQEVGSYYVSYVKDAAGNPVPIMRIPGSVVVVPQQVIDDQLDISVCSALRNVSGVSAGRPLV